MEQDPHVDAHLAEHQHAEDVTPVDPAPAGTNGKVCPSCRHEIEPAAIRDDAGLAACWECRRFWGVHELALASGELTPAYVPDINNPPAGAYFKDDGMTQIVGARIRSPGGKFLLIFGSIWGGMFLFGMYGTQLLDGDFDLALTIIGLLPASITAVILYFGLLMTIGKSEAVVRGSECLVFTGIGPWGWSKRLDTSKVTSVRVGDAGWSQNKRAMKAIIIHAGEEVKFASSLSDVHRDFVYAVLRRLLMA